MGQYLLRVLMNLILPVPRLPWERREDSLESRVDRLLLTSSAPLGPGSEFQNDMLSHSAEGDH